MPCLWWSWGYITFDSSWSGLKQWVSLNNRRDLSSKEAPPASGPAVRVHPPPLLVSLHSLASLNTAFPNSSMKTLMGQNTSSCQLLTNKRLLRGLRRDTCPTQERAAAVYSVKGKLNNVVQEKQQCTKEEEVCVCGGGIIAEIYCSQTSSCSRLDWRKGAVPWESRESVEGVTERASVKNLGTVTDLASVSLRSISAGLKLYTPSCSVPLLMHLCCKNLSLQRPMPSEMQPSATLTRSTLSWIF